MYNFYNPRVMHTNNMMMGANNCAGGQLHTIRPGDSIYKLSKLYNISVDKILAANPGIDPDNLQVGQKICIPVPPCDGEIYKIKAGDTIYGLAQKYNISVNAILQANPGVNPDNLQIGDSICIPVDTDFCEDGEIYTIKGGDTIGKLALEYGVSVNEILAANPNINPNRLQIGQKICIPESKIDCPMNQFYIIQPGDNLYALAKEFNVPYEALLNANPQLTDPANLTVGQKICVPSPMETE